MEFGKIEDISRVEWDLPPIDPVSTRFLETLGDSPLRVYFGAPAWNHKEWIGKIYPLKTKSADFLYHYSRHFTCLEMNTVHYRIPTPEQAEAWRSQVPEGFLFCPKIFKGISHAKHGLLDRQLRAEWFRFLDNLKQNCGPSFLQLPPYFSYQHKAELFAFLLAWPDQYQLAIEFRHPSWFRDGHVLPALNEYLQKRKIGLVVTDVAGRRDVLHSSVSADFALVRFIGNDLDPSDFLRADLWTHRFDEWHTQGLKKLFLFIHEPDDVKVPEMTDHFLREFQNYDWEVK